MIGRSRSTQRAVGLYLHVRLKLRDGNPAADISRRATLLGRLLMTLTLMFVLPAVSLASEPISGVGEPLGAAGAPSISSSFASPFPAVAPPVSQDPVGAAASRTAFRGFDRSAAVALATRTFHLGRPSWRPPGSEPGEHITTYLGEGAAVDRLPGGGHAVVESTIPLRVNGSSGLAPTSLTLHEAEGAYVPANPVVPVSIAKQASGGIAFPAGLSVTPVSAATPEGSALVGNHVFFANASKDTDWIVEPRPSGAEISWQLRSQESPVTQALSFHLPQGASLRWSPSTPGGVEVVAEGETLLLVPPATASDANGTSVPVSYSLSEHILTTHVDLSGIVAFPVLVDPLLFYGYYGTRNGANVWSGWQASAPSGYFGEEKKRRVVQDWYKPWSSSRQRWCPVDRHPRPCWPRRICWDNPRRSYGCAARHGWTVATHLDHQRKQRDRARLQLQRFRGSDRAAAAL